MNRSAMVLSREQILGFRRKTGHLDRRLPRGAESLRSVGWAGLQDSMPRAAVLSINARMEETEPGTWDDETLVQVWGPRFSTYVVPARDMSIFTLSRLPDSGRKRETAERLAAGLRDLLGSNRMDCRDAGRGLGVHPNQLRYAALTGTVAIRWDGARQPLVWMTPEPEIDSHQALLELARRHLHIFGPATAESFSGWAGVATPRGLAAFDELGSSLVEVLTPMGPASVLASDEPELTAGPGEPAPARFLPSGDALFLLQGPDRELLIPDAGSRARLWTPRVWPGALLVDGEIIGTWRRSHGRVTIQPWRPVSAAERHAVETEASNLPLPSVDEVVVIWDEG